MRILNLTQHAPTPEQLAQGVINAADPQAVKNMLNFVGMPTWEQVLERADKLVTLAVEAGVETAMIGGAPFLMAPLHVALEAKGIRPVYAFSERQSVEETQSDGSVKKTNDFVHVGFVG